MVCEHYFFFISYNRLILNCIFCPDIVIKSKSKLSNIVDLFLRRQHEVIPGSIAAGFSMVNILREIVDNQEHQQTRTMSDSLNGIEFDGKSKCVKNLSNYLCLNAETGLYHQDSDSSYTMISVPYWHSNFGQSYLSSRGKYVFCFQWGSKVDHMTRFGNAKISISMTQGITLYYNGSLIDHRQEKVTDGTFYNISSYQNLRLYNNMKLSIQRCFNDNSDDNSDNDR